ncbi:hypothetical protein C8R47DRAFT_1322810 [Mycena vitilis]|nr:hypothetical protein C8R47DRAFT_1322810 [Mycena vitilis]
MLEPPPLPKPQEDSAKVRGSRSPSANWSPMGQGIGGRIQTSGHALPAPLPFSSFPHGMADLVLPLALSGGAEAQRHPELQVITEEYEQCMFILTGRVRSVGGAPEQN